VTTIELKLEAAVNDGDLVVHVLVLSAEDIAQLHIFFLKLLLRRNRKNIPCQTKYELGDNHPGPREAGVCGPPRTGTVERACNTLAFLVARTPRYRPSVQSTQTTAWIKLQRLHSRRTRFL